MPRGIHYSPEQKQQMKKQALKLQDDGNNQKDIAKALGITVTTLKALLSDTPVASAPKAKRQAPAPAISETHPAVQLALKQQRVEEIDRQCAAMTEERAALQDELKTLYKALGGALFGKGN